MVYLFLLISTLTASLTSMSAVTVEENLYFVSEYDSRKEVRTLTAHKIDPKVQEQIKEDILSHRESFRACITEVVFRAIHNGKKILQFAVDSNHVVTVPCIGNNQLRIHVGAFRVLSGSLGADLFFNYRKRFVEMTILD